MAVKVRVYEHIYSMFDLLKVVVINGVRMVKEGRVVKR